MKKILITGANSYIGTSFETYLKENFLNDYVVDTVDMIDGTWCKKNFAGYDSVFHVAGIAHQKENKANAHLYYEVNRDLAIETAKKAKAEGVGQFVFLSSMSVYGMDTGIITKETKPNPKSNYGKSKWQAEQEIIPLQDDSFKVCILRPPMVYGNGCKGNYQTLVKLANVLSFFPKYNNCRSMISIDLLSVKVKSYIDEQKNGIFAPQDSEYVCTCEMVKQIANQIGKKMNLISILNPVVFLLIKLTSWGKKAFGNLIYKDFDMLNWDES